MLETPNMGCFIITPPKMYRNPGRLYKPLWQLYQHCNMIYINLIKKTQNNNQRKKLPENTSLVKFRKEVMGENYVELSVQAAECYK